MCELEPDYKDDTGKSVPLSTLCRNNPEWATSHIRNTRDEIERLTAKTEIDKITMDNFLGQLRQKDADIERLTTEGVCKDAALDRAIVAVRSLPEDALGYGKGQDYGCNEWTRWPFRDELLTELENAVSGSQKP